MPVQTPAFRRLHRLIRDPDEFTDAVSAMNLSVELHRAMTLPAHIEQFQADGWALDFSEAHVKAHVRGELPGGWASFGLVREGPVSRWSGQPAEPGMLLCLPPGASLQGCVTPGFKWTTISVPPSVWAEGRVLSGRENPGCHHFAALRLPKPLFQQLERGLQRVQRLLDAALLEPALVPGAEREARELARRVTTLVWEFAAPVECYGGALVHRGRLAKRAEAWMRAHLDHAMTIQDVCLALHVSRRELEYAFRLSFDMSPRTFLQSLRLHAIRRDLRRAKGEPGGVTRVAFHYGVTHLGRFAAQYRALFGERPGETIK